MLKSAVGIIIKKTHNSWIVEVLRHADSNNCKRTKIQVTLYFEHFKCDVLKLNRFIEEQNVVRLSYKKLPECNKIVVYDVHKLFVEKLNGRLSLQDFGCGELPVIVTSYTCERCQNHPSTGCNMCIGKKIVYVAWNVDKSEIPQRYLSTVLAEYVLLDSDEFCVDFSDVASCDVKYKLMCLIKLCKIKPECNDKCHDDHHGNHNGDCHNNGSHQNCDDNMCECEGNFTTTCKPHLCSTTTTLPPATTTTSTTLPPVPTTTVYYPCPYPCPCPSTTKKPCTCCCKHSPWRYYLLKYLRCIIPVYALFLVSKYIVLCLF